ncbi:ndufa6 NADH-ubiquinone oxidoreductase subunit [Knufia fluminis]|uniref:Ndufa6 NADH-ubiquinone oxidoreductase subunit n=1 Tax=Knufia fluminis TaxID=191047 RepID=A0AAN8EL42_9EURO|nr:ndufa6 NADH-ubiquinone oxidoreductase subunit [Knufia fluminis]
MPINPSYLAQKTRTSANWTDAKRRVIRSYREWLRAGPEIQQMYSLNMPVSKIRTKVRQEYEKHRFVNQLKAVDVLLMQSHMEFQVRGRIRMQMAAGGVILIRGTQETMNYWKQLTHIMKYFRSEEDPTAKLPRNFMSGFLEGRN